MNMNEWKKGIIASPKRTALPIMTHPGIDLIGKRVIDAVNDGGVQFRAIQALHERFPDSVAANIMMDLTVEAECFGGTVRFSDDDIPMITGSIVHDEESVNGLSVPNLDAGRAAEYLKAAELTVNAIPHKPVFAGCIGPFSLAGRLYNITDIMTAVYLEPETIQLLLLKCTSFLRKYIAAFKHVGANGVIIAEPAAGLLSSELCDSFSSQFVQTIITELQDENFLIILHNCGNSGQVTQSMHSTGAAMLHFGNNIDMVQTLEEIPYHIPVIGNLDPSGVFKMQRPDAVYTSTMDLLRATEGKKNFILSTGCDMPPGVPLENIDAFYLALRDFNRK